MRILYIDIDSLRPDHMGCYGYHRPTTPCLDQIAREGVRFNHCYCSDSPCVPSRAAFFSGRFGIRNGIVTHEAWPAGCDFRYGLQRRHGQAPTLAHHLAHAGYHTASFTTFADRHQAGWFTFGFRELHVPSLKGGNEDAPEVNAAVLPWLKANAGRDSWFVHINYWDAHTLYTEPLDYMHRMAEHPAPTWPDEETIRRQQRDLGIRSAATLWGEHAHDGFGKSRFPTTPDAIAGRGDFEHMINGYDGAIRYLDDQLSSVVSELKRQGLWDQTAMIVSADHGEAFGELGQYLEHGSVSRSVHRVPLIVRWPGVTDAAAGSARDDLVLHTDFSATIADTLGLDVPSGWSGRSLLGALNGREAVRCDPLIWTHGLHTRQRAVFDGQWLFVRTYDPGWHDYPPRMLFDTINDPHEQNNLAPREAARVAQMQATLLAWERQQIAAEAADDPLRRVQHHPPKSQAAIEQYIARLQRAGRCDDAQRLRSIRAAVASAYAPETIS